MVFEIRGPLNLRRKRRVLHFSWGHPTFSLGNNIIQGGERRKAVRGGGFAKFHYIMEESATRSEACYIKADPLRLPESFVEFAHEPEECTDSDNACQRFPWRRLRRSLDHDWVSR